MVAKNSVHNIYSNFIHKLLKTESLDGLQMMDN